MKPERLDTGLRLLTEERLRAENAEYRATGGVSANNRAASFEPAFLDTRTGTAYRSTFADGNPAPVHLLDGLPEDLVEFAGPDGGNRAVKPTVVSGFLRGDRFYTRDQAAAYMARRRWH